MQKNLVIVESTAKAKTIEKFLGADYKVVSSYGHIRDLKKKDFSIDTDTFTPEYEIPEDKRGVVAELRKLAKQAETVWLASDEDREGEAISWHLYEVLGLKPETTRRIVFHEITKNAILEAIKHPREIDINLVNAQQARRVLDRMVGFKLSPVLWKKVKPSLSAGRVQSVAVRLIVEREREVNAFRREESYRVVADLATAKGESLRADLHQRVRTKEEAREVLAKLTHAAFRVSEVTTKPAKRFPSPPFTTSTLQQEAASRLGFTVTQTMRIAQKLYEDGNITYMRTDSVNLSSLALNTAKTAVIDAFGEKYSHPRNFQTHSKGAQEAHEAIRPTYMDRKTIEGSAQERRLYELIYKRTLASQMAECEVEKTNVTIIATTPEGEELTFQTMGEVVVFDGFLRAFTDGAELKVRRHAVEEEEEDESGRVPFTVTLPHMAVGDSLQRAAASATQRFSQHPARYNEATLVRKLEELGIGRPSTYAPTISTIQQREYVTRLEKPAEEQTIVLLTLGKEKLSEKTKSVKMSSERGRLVPTDVGVVVNDFLTQDFPQIMDYNFTAEVEKKFDDVAEGGCAWQDTVGTFYRDFEPQVDATMNARDEHRVGERVLGTDPASGQPVSVKIGRFGPVIQIGRATDDEKPRFARLAEGMSMETVTLEEALELFRLPRTLGDFEDSEVVIGAGRFGPYVLHAKKFTSIPSDMDPLTITLEDAVRLIVAKRNEETQRVLRKFEEDDAMLVMNGRYGPYISYQGKNYRLPKDMQDHITELTYMECQLAIKNQPEKPARRGKK